ncbi:MAG TPA: VOC family protein [Thermoanaerobaculia bacterium]
MTKIGTISWVDLTVPDAGGLRDFYRDVTGWESVGLDMGGYEDYCMNVAGTDQTVAGICHSRGNNAGLPQQWMIYINVADLDASLEKVRSGGGEVLTPVRTMPGSGKYAFIRDPAGAACGLFEPENKE